MIDTIIKKAFLPATLVMTLLGTGVAVGQGKVTTVSKDSSSAPITLSGMSGGSVNSGDCGSVADTPNQVINVTERIDYMRVSVEAEGQPTLIVDGPSGRFCLLPDSFSGKPEMSGLFTEGVYKISVGDLSGAQHSFQLSISQQKP
ncbi:MAG: hypothetical protein WA865_22375 [Spirulinaceae cyanobacterium]